ncbi:hypothetical protein FB567DRAFT_27926 [Paraphoma chrysanthemicola]|uniref:C2H2-type domain-containing protein n=1 Tax=Paraphoma chrysanthemicola TaxID=798071 RepID=A0A8K0RKA7_9PLEO|nr:hypothetical protein FB567DRAFT_27926 [Paraphoma chrysanthemicola]
MATTTAYAGDGDESWSTVPSSAYHSANDFGETVGHDHGRSEHPHIFDPDQTPYDDDLWLQQSLFQPSGANTDASISYLTMEVGSGTLPTHPSSLHQNPQSDVVRSQFWQAHGSTVQTQTPAPGQGPNDESLLEDLGDDLAPVASSFGFLLGSTQTSPTGSFGYQIIRDDDNSRNNGSYEVDAQLVSTAQIISSTGEAFRGVAQDRGRGSGPWNAFVVVSNQSPNDTHGQPRFGRDLPSMYDDMSLNDHGPHRTFSSASEFSHLNYGPGTTWNSSAMGQGTTDTSFPPEMYESVATLRPARELSQMPTTHYRSQSRSVAATESVYYEAESPDSIEICHQDAREAMSPGDGPKFVDTQVVMPDRVLIKSSQAAQPLEILDHLRSAAEPPSPAVTVPPHEVARILECPQWSCHVRFTGKYRQGNLQRHLRLKHGSTERLYLCEQGGCEKRFKRQDARLKHYRKKHPMLAPEPPTARH